MRRNRPNFNCVFVSVFALVAAVATSNGVDFDASSVEWKLDPGLEGDPFEKAL